MSERDDNGDIRRDGPMIAAEWALGLLEGDELAAARERVGHDESFAWRKDWWDMWFAPWTDEMPAAAPDPDLWDRIAAEVTARKRD